MIQCNDVVKKYMSCTAVNHVSLSMDRGKIYTVLGPNGSGKTTLMKIIVGLILPNSGYVELDGVRVGTGTKADMVYMPTESYFYPYMKIKDIVKFEMDFYKDFSEERFYNLLENMHLEFSDKVKNMSTGMLAKLKLAVALARNAKLIMLDEPLNGIDILARETIIEAIKANIDGERTFLLSSHLVDELIVGVLCNNAKMPLFSVEERVKMLEEVTCNLPNVRIIPFEGLLVDFAKELDAKVVIRGLRAITDFEYELQMAQTNQKLQSDIETLFLTTSLDYSYLSSTTVKEVAAFGGDISQFVPEAVADRMKDKMP